MSLNDEIVLGIDVGTSGVRVAAVNIQDQLVALTKSSWPDRSGTHYRNPASWRKALKEALTQLFEQVSPDSIVAVSVDGTSGTLLALDSSGNPLGDALMYNDMVHNRNILERITAVAPDTSAVHGSSSALARAIVLQDTPRLARIVHQADWIAELLAGQPVPSDESNALKTGYDPYEHLWPDWIDSVGLKRELLPSVVACGTLTASSKGSFGLPSGVGIRAGMTDGCASFFATGATEAGDGVTVLGTTMTIKLLSDRPVFAPDYGIYSHRIGDLWLAGGASNSGGGALGKFFSTEEIAKLSAHIDPSRESGLHYYPLPSIGERFPINDPALQPNLSPRPADDLDFLHGLLEGVASVEALGYRRLAELGTPELKYIRTVGGGASNITWQTIRCRMLGVRAAPVMSSEAATGVALHAIRHYRNGR